MRKYAAVVLAAMALAVPGAVLGHSAPPVIARSSAPPWADGTTPPIGTDPGTGRETGRDQQDVVQGNQTHVIYFVPEDRPDESLDTNGVLARSIDSMLGWFDRETARGGQHARRPRMDRLAGGGHDITFVRGQRPAAGYGDLSAVADELRSRGFDAENKRYLIYAGIARGMTCGEGYWPLPGGQPARYAIVYLDSSTACGARNFGNGSAAGAGKAETIAAHEWLHNEGIASLAAPHACAGSPYHICTPVLAFLPGDIDPENVDVAFPFINKPLRDKTLDRGSDDYLDHEWPHIADLRVSSWLE